MTLKEFKEKFNEAPYDEEEFAQVVMEIDDCEKLTDITHSYLKALEKFRSALNVFELEIG